MPGIMDILGGVGSVLSAPRRGLMNLLGLPETGTEMLQQYAGMDPDSLLTKGLGFGLEAATDPLTYLGGFAARGLQKGLLGGSKAIGLGKAAAAGDGLANQAFRAELEGVPLIRNAMLTEVPSAGEIGRDANRALAISNPAENGQSLVGEIARGRKLSDDRLQGLADSMARRAAGGADNFYSPGQNAILQTDYRSLAGGLDVPKAEADLFLRQNVGLPTEELNRLTTRHEGIHAIIDNARDAGKVDQLPLMMRIPASLPSTLDEGASGAGKALGLVSNELAAHSLAHRGLPQQVLGGAQFLFDPTRNAEYASQVAHFSPAIGRLYGSLPSAFVAGGAGGGAGLGRILDYLGG